MVIPNILGLALWSPKLDSFNNSVRATKFCQELLRAYAFHRFDNVGGLSLSKMDPTLQSSRSAGETIAQVILAAANGDKLALQRFWLREIDLGAPDYDGRTALHLAACEGHLETVRFLIEICQLKASPEDRYFDHHHNFCSAYNLSTSKR